MDEKVYNNCLDYEIAVCRQHIFVMAAAKNGETIQMLDTISLKWIDCDQRPEFDWKRHEYRVKPNPNYAPYESGQEVLSDMSKYSTVVKRKYDDKLFEVFVNLSKVVSLSGKDENAFVTFNSMFIDYVWVSDGKDIPFGNKIKI